MKVLVVDDCADSTFLLSRLLENCGHEPQSAHKASEAIRIACIWRTDAVFLDIAMPGKNGYALARQLRTEAGLGDALIVAIGGYVDDEASRAASAIDAHLLKPTSIEDLQDLMTAWLNGDIHDAIIGRACPATGTA